MIIQFLLVSLLYANVGKGIYWKVILYSSIAAVIAAIFENGTVAFICRKDQDKDTIPFTVVFFFIAEIFWIFSEYSIPYLNLIKMKAFAEEKIGTIIKCIILSLAVPFVFFRLLIGYTRMTKGYLQDSTIRTYHGYAFGFMALADLICTVSVLYFLRKNSSNILNNKTNLNKHIKFSSYIILISVDIVCTLLSFLFIISNLILTRSKVLNSFTNFLHCFKCSFILLLALDAALFKYEANVSSVSGSSSSNTKSNGYIEFGINTYSKGTTMKRIYDYSGSSNDMYNDSMKKAAPFNEVFIYPPNIESYNVSNGITKNYSSRNTNSSSYDITNMNPFEINIHSTEKFNSLKPSYNY